ncbi:MAG: hypothetical protein K6G88_13545 [Lachnospiraceae bacterium]|nr:hypothetical protein [Lachnospiraceae bacterium]
MNHIDVAEIKTQYGYYENYWTIDGVALPNLLDLKSKDIDDDWEKYGDNIALESVDSFLKLS